jgi:hypothetical protein
MSSWMSVSVDVDIDDILWSASNRDKQTLADRLYEDGFKATKDTDETYDDPKTEFDEACLKLFGNGWRVTKEQEDYIIELSKRFL